MAYKLIITEKAEELLDNLIYHLIYRLKNTQAAVHLFDSIDKIYDRLEEMGINEGDTVSIYNLDFEYHR